MKFTQQDIDILVFTLSDSFKNESKGFRVSYGDRMDLFMRIVESDGNKIVVREDNESCS